MFSSLRNRVLLLIAIPFVIMLGMSTYLTLGEREERLAETRERLLSTIRLMAAEQRRIIDRSHQILLSVALLPELRRGSAPDTCGRVLSQKVKESGVFVNMLVALPNGGAICNATATPKPVNIADRDFFQRALQTHEFVVGSYIISRSTGKPTIGIAYPLLDEAGRPELVVSATLDLGWLKREIAKFDLPEGSRALVLSDEGTILARHPDPEGWVGKAMPANMSRARTLLGTGGEGTADELGLDGVRRIFGFTPLHAATTGQVYLVVGIPKDAVIGPVERNFVGSLLIAFVLLVLTFGAFWLGSERLFLGRIATLGKAAARLGQGELATRTGLQPGNDEIAQLAQSFDRMAEGLEAKERELFRANRALRVISAGNQTMLRANSERQLIEDLCRAIVETGDYHIAWVGYAENDAEKTIRPVAQGGTFVEGFFENAKLTWGEAESGRTPAGDAIRSGTPVAIQDIQKEAGREHWRQNALGSGCGSCVALPLRVAENVMGILEVCAKETGAFGDEEVRLLAQAAADLSYGIATLRGIAEQTPLRTALRIAEARLRAAAEASLDALFILKSVRDQDNNIIDFEVVDINASAEQMLGMTRDKVIGQRLRELPPVNRIVGLFDKYAQVVNTGTPLEEEFAIDTPEIKAQWLRQQVVHVDDGIAISARNITTWKAAGARLRESEETLRTIAAAAQDAILILDNDGNIALWNAAAEKIFGYSSEEAVGKNLHLLLAPARFHEAHRAGFGRFSSSGEGAVIGKTLELAALRKDGTEFPIELSLSAVKLKDKWNAIGIVRDITERKKSEEGLKLFRALLNQSTDAIEVLDAETLRFLDVNQTACLALGYSREELLSLSAFDIDSTLDRSRTTEMTQEFRELGVLTHEGRHRRKDGSEFPVEISLGHVQLDRGYMIAVARDITKRKEDELVLERANRALRTLSDCNEALVHDGDETKLLASICRLIVNPGGYRMAWVGFPEQDAAKTVRPVAHYGHEEGYLAAAKFTWEDNEFGRSPIGTAIRTGAVQINRNFLTAPAPWREAAQQRGYESSIALPLLSSAGTLGVLAIYTSESDAFDEAEVRLLQKLAGDLAFGLETLRMRAEHDRIAYENLHHSEILRQSLEDSIKAIAATVEMRDPYTAGHQRRVGQLSVAIARELGLPEHTIRGIELAASIHDLGKISVPAEILAKPSKLTAIEYMLLKNHAQAGYDILKDIKFPWPIATMVWQHHERIDGSGYPQGLKDGEILLESRIMAVADVVEAMASHRPYRAALGIDSALKELERSRGTAYDAAVVDACVRLFAEARFAFST